MMADGASKRGSAKAMKVFFDSLRYLFKLSRLPGAGRTPWLRPDKTDMRWLPINQDIEMPENAPMPLSVLDRLIEEASHRVVYKVCGCRLAYGCEHYPTRVGCLVLGDSALEGRFKHRKEVDVEEAKRHARAAVDAGLVPIVGKARVDNTIFGIKDRGRLVTVCFCCECCCITRFVADVPLARVEPIFPRLEGVSITVTDECTGCGKCAEHCYVNAITIEDKRAAIGGYCRACGRCATVCPREAIKVKLDDPDYVDKTIERIRSYVKYD